MTKQKQPRKKYDDDYKVKIVEDIAAKRMTYTDAVNQGIYTSMLARWRKAYAEGKLKRSENAQHVDGTALVPIDPRTVEVIPAQTKRKYTKRVQTLVLTDPDAQARHNEMVVRLDRGCRFLVAEFQAGTAGVEELLKPHVVEMINAAHAARGGK